MKLGLHPLLQVTHHPAFQKEFSLGKTRGGLLSEPSDKHLYSREVSPSFSHSFFPRGLSTASWLLWCLQDPVAGDWAVPWPGLWLFLAAAVGIFNPSNHFGTWMNYHTKEHAFWFPQWLLKDLVVQCKEWECEVHLWGFGSVDTGFRGSRAYPSSSFLLLGGCLPRGTVFSR